MMYSHPSLAVSRLKVFFVGFSFVSFVVTFSSGFQFRPTTGIDGPMFKHTFLIAMVGIQWKVVALLFAPIGGAFTVHLYNYRVQVLSVSPLSFVVGRNHSS
jgi:hypothetical protein